MDRKSDIPKAFQSTLLTPNKHRQHLVFDRTVTTGDPSFLVVEFNLAKLLIIKHAVVLLIITRGFLNSVTIGYPTLGPYSDMLCEVKQMKRLVTLCCPGYTFHWCAIYSNNDCLV